MKTWDWFALVMMSAAVVIVIGYLTTLVLLWEAR